MDKALQREKTRERVQRYRDKQKGVTLEGVTEQGVTYPAIILALADKDKRDKITRICNQLKARRLLESVRYGIGGPTFTEVDKMLSCLT